jgi:hypothetical protein
MWCKMLKQHSLTCEVGFRRTLVPSACMRDYCSVLTITQQEDKIHKHRRVMLKVGRKDGRWHARQTTQLKRTHKPIPTSKSSA